MKEPRLDPWVLFKDTVMFQLKLGMDALRDLLLSPVSIICALVDFFRSKTLEQSTFYKLMALGYKTDKWINLFGAHQRVGSKFDSVNPYSAINKEVNVDRIFDQVEALIKEQHKKGGLTATAKSSIDRYLDKIVSKGASNSFSTEKVSTKKVSTENSPTDNNLK